MSSREQGLRLATRKAALLRDEIHVLHHHRGGREVAGELADRRDPAEPEAGRQQHRATRHLRREIHDGERLPRTRRAVEEDAAVQRAAGGHERLRVLGERDRVALHALERAGREHDRLALDGRQTMELHERLHAHLARGDGDDLPPVHVALGHRGLELAQEVERDLALRGDGFYTKQRARTELLSWRAAHEDDEPALALADDEEPELHADEDAVALELEVHVVDRTLVEPSPGPARREEIGERDLAEPLVRDGDPHDLR